MNDLLALAIVNGLIWVGLFLYLLRLETKLKRIERDMN